MLTKAALAAKCSMGAGLLAAVIEKASNSMAMYFMMVPDQIVVESKRCVVTAIEPEGEVVHTLKCTASEIKTSDFMQ
ncbi:hypothetical protein [Marinicella meishanensis]|uniref:hypothetical protein n=1 Tax=Marinicella meishanensis TaxID=2873263 RepID=UPI001CBBF833|nr:hypothetical protein [Marinicella sp. NBU2979]